MRRRSAQQIRQMAEGLLVRAGNPWVSDAWSERLVGRSTILLVAAAMADERERPQPQESVKDPSPSRP